MNEITVDELFNQMGDAFIGDNGYAFADEEPVKAPVDVVEDLPVSFSDDDLNMDEMSLEDFNKMLYDDEEELIDEATDLIEKDVNTFDDDDEETYWLIDGKELAQGEVKAAVRAMDKIKEFDTMKEHFREGMNRLADEFARSEYMNNSVLDEAVDHWYKKMTDSKTNEEFKYNQSNYQSALDRRESGKAKFEKFNRELQAGREEQDRLNSQHVVNELIYSNNWQMSDFAEVNQYINENGIQIKPNQASAKLLMTIKKAAAFDNQRKSKESELRSKAKVKPLTASPVNASNIDTIASKENNNKKRKLEKKLAAGIMTDEDRFDLFSNLTD